MDFDTVDICLGLSNTKAAFGIRKDDGSNQFRKELLREHGILSPDECRREAMRELGIISPEEIAELCEARCEEGNLWGGKRSTVVDTSSDEVQCKKSRMSKKICKEIEQLNIQAQAIAINKMKTENAKARIDNIKHQIDIYNRNRDSIVAVHGEKYWQTRVGGLRCIIVNIIDEVPEPTL
jgi:hypothetical protein